jgi:hypothetical protein
MTLYKYKIPKYTLQYLVIIACCNFDIFLNKINSFISVYKAINKWSLNEVV